MIRPEFEIIMVEDVITTSATQPSESSEPKIDNTGEWDLQSLMADQVFPAEYSGDRLFGGKPS